MKPSAVLQEIRRMRFEEIYQQRTEKSLSIEEAAKLLGVCERTFRRWTHRYEEEGAAGLFDKRLDRAAHNTAPVNEVLEILNLFETYYRDFNVSHFYDKYRFNHGGSRSYTWIKKCLQDVGLVKKAKKRGEHRRKRPRRPLKGMMLHQDGSTHQWVEGVYWDLIVTLDDADNEIYSAFFVEEEGTWSSFRGVREVIDTHGLFCSLYTDRGSHYWSTPEAGGKVNKRELTQFGRVMSQLGIDMIAAYSPEARGRSERMFGTLQNRLPAELRLADITSMSLANEFLKNQFIPEFNQRFKLKLEEEENAFIPWLNVNTHLNDIFCLQETRTVNRDNTVSYRNKSLQIARDPMRHSFSKVKIKLNEYENGNMAIFHGPKCLGRYDANGQAIIEKAAKRFKNHC